MVTVDYRGGRGNSTTLRQVSFIGTCHVRFGAPLSSSSVRRPEGERDSAQWVQKAIVLVALCCREDGSAKVTSDGKLQRHRQSKIDNTSSVHQTGGVVPRSMPSRSADFLENPSARVPDFTRTHGDDV